MTWQGYMPIKVILSFLWVYVKMIVMSRSKHLYVNPQKFELRRDQLTANGFADWWKKVSESFQEI